MIVGHKYKFQTFAKILCLKEIFYRNVHLNQKSDDLHIFEIPIQSYYDYYKEYSNENS